MPTSIRRPLHLALIVLMTALSFVVLSGATTDTTGKAHAATISFRAKAVQIASYKKGDPYRYGAAGPNAFDCSGLTLYVYRQVGKSLVHNAAGQYRQTIHIAKANKRPGDLIFYVYSGSITHVAIYAGNGYTWVAPHTGARVERQRIYTSHYLVGRVRA